MKRHIIIISDQSGGSSNPITHELIACAKILQQLTALPLKILITGSRPDDAASRLFEKYGIDALVVRHGNPLISNDITIKIMPVSLISDLNPSFILLPHTTEGLDAAPGLAVKINAACITGVEKVTRRENAVCFTRSVFGDKIGVQMNSTANTTVLTVAPGCFKPETGPVPYDGKLEHIDIDLHTESYRLVDRQPNTADSSAITDADVIVSAGNGIREKEDLALVYNLAAAFPRSAVTGSRPICDKKMDEIQPAGGGNRYYRRTETLLCLRNIRFQSAYRRNAGFKVHCFHQHGSACGHI